MDSLVKNIAQVQARNAEVKSRQNAMQKLFNEAMRAQIEELKKKEEMSGMTENQ